MLIEDQVTDRAPDGTWLGPFPVEYDDVLFDVIQMATNKHIIVVEPAGNAAIDLGTLGGRFDRGVRDSGAIIVAGAEYSPDPAGSGRDFVWDNGVNYGSRVDCFAWSSDVMAPYMPPDQYRSDQFNASSSASAIVAGAAAVISGLALRALGRPLTPQEARSFLADRERGTHSRSPQPIGVMPNLAKLVEAPLRPSEDMVLRDHPGDTGGWHDRRLGLSPDIIVRRAAVTDPEVAFGSASGTLDSLDLCDPVRAGSDYVVYVRPRNRGRATAGPVRIRVFHAPVATLLTPDLWIPLGGIATTGNAPRAGALVVSEAIEWPASEVPGSGPRAFVAIAGSPGDPAPALVDPELLLPRPFSWRDFLGALRYSNNLAWRNVHALIGTVTPMGTTTFDLPFLLTGAPDAPRVMRLEVGGDLPAGSRAALRVPRELVEAGVLMLPARGLPDGLGTFRMDVSPAAGSVLLEGRLAAGLRLACAFEVTLPVAIRGLCHTLSVRQFQESMEVGRIEWGLTA